MVTIYPLHRKLQVHSILNQSDVCFLTGFSAAAASLNDGDPCVSSIPSQSQRRRPMYILDPQPLQPQYR